MAFGILWIFLLRPFLFERLWGSCAPLLRVMDFTYRYRLWFAILQWLFVVAFGICAIVMVCVDDPVVRSCTRDPNFPVHFGLLSAKNSVRGIVRVTNREGYLVWDMIHYPWEANPDAYSLRLWRRWDYERHTYSNVTWPEDRAVREMVYNLPPRGEEGKGTMMGLCGAEKLACLNGTVEMEPLRLEWTYTDPVTNEKVEKTLQSEGRWQFGTTHRPWVNLGDRNNENPIFSAPSSKWVCGGGDGDLRDSVVPVGLIMIAEQRYNKRY
jgi:hypothetical protein